VILGEKGVVSAYFLSNHKKSPHSANTMRTLYSKTILCSRRHNQRERENAREFLAVTEKF
jgi:hypothetical protein